MINFVRRIPTKFVFGRGVEAQTGVEVKALGATKVLLHYGGGSAVRSGLIGRIETSLQAAGVPYVMLGGAQPNPRDTPRQVACLPGNTSRGKRSSMPQPKTRPDSPVPSLQGPCDRTLKSEVPCGSCLNWR